jgi:hypothetical protein
MNNLLGQLPFESGAVTRMINAENPTGEKGGGARWVPDPSDPNLPHSGAAAKLGKGWKVRPFIAIKAGATAVLADIEGPGCINQFWITTSATEFRALVLRMYWDDEEAPSVEVPLGDFFAMGFDAHRHTVTSLPVVVAPHRGCNCYWQMPFRRRARITLTNEATTDLGIVAFKVLYKLHPVPDDAAYLHVQWRRSRTTREHPEHTILDGARGRGIYAGTYVAWQAFSTGWWGEGEVKFFLDGDSEHPTICDNGTEDYFGGAWCFYRHPENDRVEEVFNAPFNGMPLASASSDGGPRSFGLYRWHVVDGIGFERDLRVTVQALGWWPDHTYQPLQDDIASTAFWYQQEPHAAFPALPPASERCRASADGP